MAKNKIKWKVKGLDRVSGEARSMLVDASNEWTARNRAADAGVVVESIAPLRPVPKSALGAAAPAVRRPVPAQKPVKVMSEGERTFWSIFKKIALGYGILFCVLVFTAITILFVIFFVMFVILGIFASAF